MSPVSLSNSTAPRVGDTRLLVRDEVADGSTTLIPHDCEPETLPAPSERSASRFLGVDVARAVALFGMIAVHVLPLVGADGTMSAAYVLFSGKSAALFALLAGVGIAFATGRSRRPEGRQWISAMTGVLVRALLIASLGLALGSVIPVNRAAIILVSYGVMFLLAVLLLRLTAPMLAVLAGVIAVAMPLVSHVLRQDLAAATRMNPTFSSLLQDPGATVRDVLLTGTFPALAWMAYVCAGMAVGRMDLTRRGAVLRITITGLIVAIGASGVSWLLMVQMGGTQALAAASTTIMSREDFIDTLVWGAGGTLPVNSPWWLAVLAPHTSTPMDILFTMGIAMVIVGVALTFAIVTSSPLRPLGRVGSMPLTVYVLHLLLLIIPGLPAKGSGLMVLHVVVLSAFALTWRHFFKRGPLEQGLWWLSNPVRRFVEDIGAGRPTHRARRFVQGTEAGRPMAMPKRQLVD